MERVTYNFWVVIKPAPDIPGQWLAHCLEVDVVSQGNSPDEAYKNGCEAAWIVTHDDLSRGANPVRRRATEDCWEELYDLQRNGTRVVLQDALKAAEESAWNILAVQVPFSFNVEDPEDEPEWTEPPVLFGRERGRGRKPELASC